MTRVLVLVPFPFDEHGLSQRRLQLKEVRLGPDISFDYKPVRASPALFDSHHDLLLAEVAMFEAGCTAEDDGYDAVCIDTMSDSGMRALRSVLDIPVIAPALASYSVAIMLGGGFSVLTQWDPWMWEIEHVIEGYGLSDHFVSVRSINRPPDVENLLTDDADEALPAFISEGERCVDDGAKVICLGSTTMHQVHKALADALPVPVINPGPVTYKIVEAMLALDLTHSRVAYRRPDVPKLAVFHAMLDGAAAAEPGGRW